MGVIAKQSFKSSVFTYMGIVLGYVNTFVLFPRIFTEEQFGLVSLLISIAALTSQFLLVGFPQVAVRYFPFFRDRERNHQGFVFMLFFLPMLLFLVFGLLFFLLPNLFLAPYQDKSPLLNRYYWIIPPLTLFLTLFALLQAYARALYRTVLATLANEVLLRIGVTICILLFYFGAVNYFQFMGTYLLAYSIPVLLLIGSLIFLKEFLVKPDFSLVRAKKIGEILVYSMFTFLTSTGNMVVARIDIIMLGMLSGLKETALYTVAFYIGNVIQVPARSITNIAGPVVANAIKNENFDAVRSIYQKSSINNFIAGCFIFAGVWANMHNIMALLPDNFTNIETIILLVGVGRLISIMVGINGQIIVNSVYFRFNLYISLVMIVVAIITNYIFIPLYGMAGAALATAISLLIIHGSKVLYVWYRFKMQPFTWATLLTIIIAGLSFGLSKLLPVLDVWYDIPLRSALVSLVFLPAVYWLKLSPDANTYIDKLLRKVGIGKKPK